jgi:hypothetical protein
MGAIQVTTAEKPKPVSMDTVNDGILHGKQGATKGDCEVCGFSTRCLHIYEVHMPDGIEVGKTIVANRLETPTSPAHNHITLIGIGCGCYAKFHRQVAHIQDKMAVKAEKKKDKKGKGALKDGGKKKKKHGRT